MITVVICTFNPREDYLRRALEGLHNQTLEEGAWELVIVDNNSDNPIDGRFDFSWKANARVVTENEPGLTPARIKGIREGKGDLFVFVDDDNILDEKYLENAERISKAFPFLGAWGGSSIAEYEEPPPNNIKQYENLIGVRTVERIVWSNIPFAVAVIGAGMVIRREVCEKYLSQLVKNPFRRGLDRKGSSLIGGGDIDMANEAIDLGYGLGNFPNLLLIHLIPKRRVEPEYLVSIARAIATSKVITRAIRGVESKRNTSQNPVRRFVMYLYILVSQGWFPFCIYRSRWLGYRDGLKFWEQRYK